MSAEAKNLERITAAIKHHNSTCDWPATAVLMNPFEVERLGWEEIAGVPVEPDAELGTGRFWIACKRDSLGHHGANTSTEDVRTRERVPVNA